MEGPIKYVYTYTETWYKGHWSQEIYNQKIKLSATLCSKLNLNNPSKLLSTHYQSCLQRTR